MRRRAFTITELLVVVSIIFLLVAMVFIALGQVSTLARGTVCSSNQRQIGISIQSYATDFNGHIYEFRNWGKWLNPNDQSEIIDPTHSQAYWGVMYATYIDGGPELFHCPEAVRIDPDQADIEALEGKPCNCYGLNGYGTFGFSDAFRTEYFGAPSRIALFERNANGYWLGRSVFHAKYPSDTVFCHDAYETVLDGNGDTLNDWYQYNDYGLDDRNGEQIKNDEYLRHNGKCNCVWFDGHISSETEEACQQAWYLGTGRRYADDP
jgi:prepilin-type processing-associated H-X9-DG protein